MTLGMGRPHGGVYRIDMMYTRLLDYVGMLFLRRLHSKNIEDVRVFLSGISFTKGASFATVLPKSENFKPRSVLLIG
jgi:hypothetical protein